ncbi:MAG TPA: hypothetical protein VHT75_19475 [Acidimicrobiales bacterium]|jgi:hypothetical protein|nr:hypothetical protein [Acidimicrobiales bacterium]
MVARYALLVQRTLNFVGVPVVTGVYVIRTTDGGATWEPYTSPVNDDEGKRIVAALNTAAEADAVAALHAELEAGGGS